MKSLLRHFFVSVVAIFLLSKLLPGISYSHEPLTLMEAALLLTGVNLFLRPVVNLVALPINFLTLGLFSFLINAFLLYLVTLIVPGFKVTEFDFLGVNFLSVSVSRFHVSVFFSFILVAAGLGLLRSFFLWLCSK